MKNKSAHVFYSPALRYFVEVAEVGSIRGAARRLNVVSSAVNRQVLNLEEQFGLKLFDRIGRGIKLSEAGEVLLVHAKRSLTDFDNALEALHDLSGLKRGLVKVAVVESVADTLMAKVISQFHQEYPGIEVDVQVSSSARVIKAIQSSQVHVAIGFNVQNHEGLDIITAKELEIGLALSPKHPLAKRKQLSLLEAAEYPITIPVETLSIGKIVAEGLAKQNIKAATLLKANSLKFMKLMAIEHQYIAFQTKLGIQKEADDNLLTFIPIDEPKLKKDQLALVTNKMHDLSLAPKTFIKYLDQALKDFEPNID